MKNYDIFNGDADGLISLHQYRLQFPRKSELITGVKRDVKLLRHLVDINNASLSVFDISLLSNSEYVEPILNNGNKIKWFDHHETGDTDFGNNFSIKVDTDPTCCTNIIVDKVIDGLHRPWTICGAYGDNLH
jgi:oligoribonuclease NrnB/cAMP/cGMP phosphodiesterase (DHH superfamily)